MKDALAVLGEESPLGLVVYKHDGVSYGNDRDTKSPRV